MSFITKNEETEIKTQLWDSLWLLMVMGLFMLTVFHYHWLSIKLESTMQARSLIQSVMQKAEIQIEILETKELQMTNATIDSLMSYVGGFFDIKIDAATISGMDELEHISTVGDAEIKRTKETLALHKRKQRILNEKKTRGSIGRLYIPEVGIDVALFQSSEQSVVDDVDSAAFFRMKGQDVIGDHNVQGFSKIRKMVPGRTYAYIEDGNIARKYRCIAKIDGHNREIDITDENEQSVLGRYPNTIMLYTCKNHWSNISIIFLQPV